MMEDHLKAAADACGMTDKALLQASATIDPDGDLSTRQQAVIDETEIGHIAPDKS